MLERSPHACTHEASRLVKAAKITRLLDAYTTLRAASVLDIGTGSGVIASELSRATGPEGHVISLDVVDVRTVTRGYQYRRVDSVELPFDDFTFDVVISNHVIEHVGGPEAQQRHLKEIHRVLKQDGVCYLATPNRWTIIEPHFRLPFLSWLPPKPQHAYVRLIRQGSNYDCRLLTRRELEQHLAATELAVIDVTSEALIVLAELEEHLPARIVNRLPAWIRRPLLPLAPTMVLLIRPRR